MRRRSPSPPSFRPRGRSRGRLGLEPLESRRVLASTLAAIGSDLGPTSTPLVRLVDVDSGDVVAETLAFEEAFHGGVRLAMANVDGLPGDEVVVASGPGRPDEIRVFTIDGLDGRPSLRELPAFRLAPFGGRFFAGVTVAAGDVDGNQVADIIAGQSRGSEVRVFLTEPFGGGVEAKASAILRPFGDDFLGGTGVAVADVGRFTAGSLADATRPDGVVEVMVASGTGRKGEVAAFTLSGDEPHEVDRFDVFDPAFRGGLSLTSGRYDADEIDDVFVSPGIGGASVEIYDGRVSPEANPRLASFAAFTGLAHPRSAVFAAGVDRNGDGRIDGYAASQGVEGGGGGSGMAFVSQAGARAAVFASLAGPASVATARTSFIDFATTISGIRYRVIRAGDGVRPTTGQTVSTHYTGWLVDGSKFDSSRDRGTPFEFTLGAGNVIAGWDEMLAGMTVGERRTVIIPPHLAYGSTARPGIPANSTLVFDIELVAIR